MRVATRALWFGTALSLLFALMVLPSSGSAAPQELPAKVVAIDPPVSTAAYPSIDYGATNSPTDDHFARTRWRVVEETGNCCETYLTTTAWGWLLDFGGSYINYSRDHGKTWLQVQPLTPLVNGEGAIVAAPGGDILGVEWDPYSGDHLQFYKFEGDTRSWQYTEMPVHSPFYDREWIGVVPGPITIDGETYEYVSFVKGGYPSKEPWFYSTDGLNYQRITSKALDQMVGGNEVEDALRTTPAALNDWVQANSNSLMTPLGESDMLAAPDFGSSWLVMNGRTFSWSLYRFADGSTPQGRFQIDSAGRIHNVIPASDGGSFDYRVSSDGGMTWRSVHVALPKYHAIEEWDFRANRAAGVAAVGLHTSNLASGNDEDLVYKLDIRRVAPRLTRFYQVGLGDVDATAGVGNDIRFDFGSITIMPDGAVAVSFMDSTTTGPTTSGGERVVPGIAIERGTRLGASVPVTEDVPPALGEAYASYTFDEGDEGWTTDLPVWERGQPGTKDGSDDAGSAGYGIDQIRYIDSLETSLTSPKIDTEAGLAVVQFWVKTDTEEGFDFLRVEWSSDGSSWVPISQFSGKNEDFPNWTKVTVGFESPGGEIQVRFRFTSDQLCSGADHACGEFTGVRVDEVTVGKQAV